MSDPNLITTLPHQHKPRPPLEEGTRRKKYQLSASEALEGGGQSVQVKDETGRVVWTRRRNLVEDEIVSTVFDSSQMPRWSIHRPTTGWYLVLRSPSLPPGSFVSLKPSTKESPEHFTFHIRSVLNFPSDREEAARSSANSKRTSTRIDVPPPALSVPDGVEDPLSAGSQADLLASSTGSNDSSSPTKADSSTSAPSELSPPLREPSKSHFLLSPHLPAHTHRQSSSPFSISRFTSLFADRGTTFSCTWLDERDAEVLRYEDAPGLFSLATHGSLYLNVDLINMTGMEPSFWVAIACAYLEFLEEREAWEAANKD
ncbi:hypothetical protein T439DRAFT_324083 [Meredithblackwellia eburnea MCA 4105]